MKSQKKKKSGSSGKLILLPIGAVALTILGFEGVDMYYSSRIESREAQRVGRLQQDGYSGRGDTVYSNWSITPIWFKRDYLNRIEDMEQDFSPNLEDLVKFIDLNKKDVLRLADNSLEQGGYIEKTKEWFKLVHTTQWKNDLSNWLSRTLEGDFSHKKEIIGHINRYGALINLSRSDVQLAPLMFDQIESFYTSKRSPYDISTTDAASFFVNVFNAVTENDTTTGIDQEFIQNKDMIARFHTHPKNDKQYFPSSPDKANTFIVGPQFLFCTSNGVLYVHSILKGESKLVYQYKIPDS